jgi:proteasome lid subunit RPN8/RPN11
LEFVIRLANGVVDAVIAHAREAAPAECCGLLVGRGDEIVAAVRARNIASEPTRFLIDPHDHIDGRRDARRRGLEVVGFYHSHPRSAAVPSETDVAEATYTGHLYLIVSLAGDTAETRLFRLEKQAFRALPFATIDEGI